MSINQHDFMKNQSTITNLLEYASFVLNSIEDGNQIDSIYTDFSKAFDRVRHQLMLNGCLWVSSPQDACGWDLICQGEEESATQFLRISRSHRVFHRKVIWDYFVSYGLSTEYRRF
jgi:hypothetical protein